MSTIGSQIYYKSLSLSTWVTEKYPYGFTHGPVNMVSPMEFCFKPKSSAQIDLSDHINYLKKCEHEH